MAESHHIGQRLSYGGALCTVRYTGAVEGTSGTWLGVEWDDSSRGKHDGSHKGTRYFSCLSKSPTAASFIRPTRVADPPQTFLSALQDKYAPENEPQGPRIVFSGKVAEEVGFDKIARQLAQISNLKILILDGQRIVEAGDESIEETCPKVRQVDLSRNLFETLHPVLEICRQLPALSTLAISGNRFQNVVQEDTEALRDAFGHLRELAIEDNLLTWEAICHIAAQCPLTTLKAGTNQLSMLPNVDYGGLTSSLTSLDLEFNSITNFAQLASLTELKALRNLHLKGNNITEFAPEGSTAPTFPQALQYLDVSYNSIQTWSFIDEIPKHFPGVTGLRLSHNPVYDTPDQDAKAASSEEAHMITIGRLASLKSLNFAQVRPADRSNAEMFYLSRIAKQLATVPEAAAQTILQQHPRWAELCELYGEPDIIRREEINPSFLEARLIEVNFEHREQGKRRMRVPKSFDIYAVKGIAGRLFGLEPLRIKLIWETGEWDPVAGYDDEDRGDSSEEEDEDDGHKEKSRVIKSTEVEPSTAGEEQEDEESQQAGKTGRWVKREIELKDGPRQLGYCVEGSNAVIRVESK